MVSLPALLAHQLCFVPPPLLIEMLVYHYLNAPTCTRSCQSVCFVNQYSLSNLLFLDIYGFFRYLSSSLSSNQLEQSQHLVLRTALACLKPHSTITQLFCQDLNLKCSEGG
jgi:hypothetical protein